MGRKVIIRGLLATLLALAGPAAGEAGGVYAGRLGEQRGSEATFRPHGPTVIMGAIDPARHTWYLPQDLYEENRFRQWETTRYATQPYQRYVNPAIEGSQYYDLYGNLLTRGWLIYNIDQTSPEEDGSVVFKDNRFSRWFSQVVVAADRKGSHSYALTVSNDLRTSLSPLVLSKVRMDGLQIDALSDKYQSSFIYSRISGPRTTLGTDVRRTNLTSLVAGRFEAQVGDFLQVGFHSANVHQSNTQNDKALLESFFKGNLTEAQNEETVNTIVVVLRDDSPADGVGGAAFFPDASDIIIRYADGSIDRGKQLRFEPVVEGGFPQSGYLAADGGEEITLTYDFNNPAFIGRASGAKEDIVEAEIRLVLANDYQVWMSSDQQTNTQGEPVLLMVAQAEGNPADLSNLTTVSFEYGLPTATHVAGATIELKDLAGFRLYGEYDRSWSYRKYPNITREKHETASGILGQRSDPAWMLNLSKNEGPWFAYAEGYSIDPQYNTSGFIADADGDIDYSLDQNRIDLVEDNDDQDRVPDAFRGDWVFPDLQVFPGWDVNNDFVADFNQNDNRVKLNNVPDYEEPFLRFDVDQPEFLFGVDMNNNFWVDIYENDDAPEYPYPRDHEGYNIYAGVHLTPEIRLMAGMLREGLISSDQENHSTYAMIDFDRQASRLGRFRVFEMTKLVADDIPDQLLQWSTDNTILGGQLTPIADPLLARDTWINQLFVGHTFQSSSSKLRLTNKLNWMLFRQLMNTERRERFGLNSQDFYFGLMNKASYDMDVGAVSVQPRWKSAFQKQTRDLFTDAESTRLQEQFSILAEVKVLRSTRAQAGVEYVISEDFDVDANDVTSTIVGLQLSNLSAYLGYQITAQVGIVVERRDPHGGEAFTSTQTFVTIYAGL